MSSKPCNKVLDDHAKYFTHNKYVKNEWITFFGLFRLHLVQLNSTWQSIKTNSTCFNPLIRSESQPQPVSTQTLGQVIRLSPINGSGFQPLIMTDDFRCLHQPIFCFYFQVIQSKWWSSCATSYKQSLH